MSKAPVLLSPFDAFKDAEQQENSIITGFINIRVFKKSANSKITIIEGLPKIFNHPKILKHFRSSLSCNGHIIEDKDHGTIIQLQGEHIESIKQFLLEEEFCKENQIRIYG